MHLFVSILSPSTVREFSFWIQSPFLNYVVFKVDWHHQCLYAAHMLTFLFLRGGINTYGISFESRPRRALPRIFREHLRMLGTMPEREWEWVMEVAKGQFLGDSRKFLGYFVARGIPHRHVILECSG